MYSLNIILIFDTYYNNDHVFKYCPQKINIFSNFDISKNIFSNKCVKTQLAYYSINKQ